MTTVCQAAGSTAGPLTQITNYPVNVAVPDGNLDGLTDTRQFASPIWKITHLRVRLAVEGRYNGDLYACLTHDSGHCVLLNRPGRRSGNPLGYSDAGLDVVFDDAAPSGDVHNYRLALNGSHNVPLQGPLTNTWAPDGRAGNPRTVLDTDLRTEWLHSFDGLDPNGGWTLHVADVGPSDRHTLVGWGLEVAGDPPPAPVITSQPLSREAECGDAVSFAVRAEEEVPLSYRWRRNGVDLVDGGNISGSTTANLTIVPAGSRDAGIYTVRISDDTGTTTSEPAELMVRDTSPPAVVCPDNPTFECSGTAGTPVTFEIVVSDDCDPEPRVVCIPPSGSLLPLGDTTILCTGIDASSNTTARSFTVTVVDITPPMLSLPPDILVPADAGQCFAGEVVIEPPAVGDNSGYASLTNDVQALYGAGRDWLWVDPVHGNDVTAVRGDYRQAYRTLSVALTNAQDNDTIVMLPGTNLIRCAISRTNVPELFITRSNLSILGQAGATLVATNLGDGVLCSNAANVKIRGLTLRGFRTSDDAVPFEVWTGIHLLGGCDGAEIAGNTLDNWMNQGIAVLNGDSSTSTNVWVHHNSIRRCGFIWRTTNGFPLNRFDGAAIVPDGGWLVENNLIEDCAIGIEPYPPDNLGTRAEPCIVRNNALTNNLTGISGGNSRCPVLITGNTVVNATNYSWVINTNFNPWIGLSELEVWFPFGVAFDGSFDSPVVSNNVISGWRMAICAVHGSMTNAVITGNIISETWQAGILLGDGAHGVALSRNVNVSGNVITNAMSQTGFGALSLYHLADAEIAENSISGTFSSGVLVCSSTLASSNVVVRDTWLNGSFDWGVLIGDGTRAAVISNTEADSATFRWGKYYTNGAEVVIEEGTAAPTPPSRPLVGEGFSRASGIPAEMSLENSEPVRFPVGTNLVTWTATDSRGNTASCQQRVIVLDPHPLPTVSIQRDAAGDSIVVSWPQTCSQVMLERSPLLDERRDWTPVSYAPTLADGVYRVTIPAVFATRFYRLRRP